MILDVDIGNTRIKWLLNSTEQIEMRGVVAVDDLGHFFKSLSQYASQISRVRVASVRPSVCEAFDSGCEQLFDVKPEYAVVTKQFGQLTNAYIEVDQMGVDRWLNMIAATTLVDCPCAVVSAGSAITIDLLNEDRQHLGGFIAPGLQLMRQSLYRDTDQVKLNQIDYDVDCLPAGNTQQAVASGLMMMQVGLIEQSLKFLESKQPTLLLTGGDSERLKATCSKLNGNRVAKIVVEPDLVFKGLALALKC